MVRKTGSVSEELSKAFRQGPGSDTQLDEAATCVGKATFAVFLQVVFVAKAAEGPVVRTDCASNNRLVSAARNLRVEKYMKDAYPVIWQKCVEQFSHNKHRLIKGRQEEGKPPVWDQGVNVAVSLGKEVLNQVQQKICAHSLALFNSDVGTSWFTTVASSHEISLVKHVVEGLAASIEDEGVRVVRPSQNAPAVWWLQVNVADPTHVPAKTISTSYTSTGSEDLLQMLNVFNTNTNQLLSSSSSSNHDRHHNTNTGREDLLQRLNVSNRRHHITNQLSSSSSSSNDDRNHKMMALRDTARRSEKTSIDHADTRATFRDCSGIKPDELRDRFLALTEDADCLTNGKCGNQMKERLYNVFNYDGAGRSRVKTDGKWGRQMEVPNGFSKKGGKL